MRIKMTLALIATGVLLATGYAAAATPEQLKQQEKMKTCNADASAKSLKGAERQKFMSTCLSSH